MGEVVTRGDSGQENDAPTQQVLGKVIAAEREGKQSPVEGSLARLKHSSRRLMCRAKLSAPPRRFKQICSVSTLFALLVVFGALINAAPAWAQAALTITDSAAPTSVLPGTTITYTQILSNTSGARVTPNITVTQNVPANTTFVSATPTGSGTWNTCTNAGKCHCVHGNCQLQQRVLDDDYGCRHCECWCARRLRDNRYRQRSGRQHSNLDSLSNCDGATQRSCYCAETASPVGSRASRKLHLLASRHQQRSLHRRNRNDDRLHANPSQHHLSVLCRSQLDMRHPCRWRHRCHRLYLQHHASQRGQCQYPHRDHAGRCRHYLRHDHRKFRHSGRFRLHRPDSVQ